MKCPKCGNELEPGQLFCEICGQEIQMVPDYDPLDEVRIGQDETQDEPQEEPKPGTEEHEKKKKTTEKAPETDPKKDAGKGRTKRGIGFAGKALLLAAGLLVCFLAFLFSYRAMTRGQNYDWQLRKGLALYEKEQYEEALPYLAQAQELQEEGDGTDTTPLRSLAWAYAYLGEEEQALTAMEDAIEMEMSARGENYELEDIYQELMEVMNLVGATESLNEVIDDCPYEAIREALEPYRIEKPSCSQPEGTYNYYLRLELTAAYGSVYYTLDGSEPTKESTRYEEPIEIQEEGEFLLSAVAINKKGIVSEPFISVYRIDFDDE